MTRRLHALFLLAVLMPVGAYAQMPPPPPAAPAQPATEIKPDARAYVVGAGDRLSITIYGEELPREYTVGVDGLINFPLIGDTKIAGMSLREIEAEIRKRMIASGYFTSPQVVAEVIAYRSQVVQVQGQVNNQGDITLGGDEMTLSRALARAGLTAFAGSYVEIRRRRPDAPADAAGNDAYTTQRVERADIKSLKVDPRLQDGDHVLVPKAPVFFLNGFVKTTGQQVWTPGMTVGKAIAAAGGLSERGTFRGLKIKRLINGEYKEINVKENSLVQPEDQIVVAQRRF